MILSTETCAECVFFGRAAQKIHTQFLSVVIILQTLTVPFPFFSISKKYLFYNMLVRNVVLNLELFKYETLR